MKKTIAILAALVMTLGGAAYLPMQEFSAVAVLTASAATGEFTEGAYQYNVKADGTVVIEKYTGSEATVKIPSTLGGKTVTEIGERAFALNRSIVTVNIPDTVKVLGDHAFFLCYSLTNISIPDSVTTVKNSCFWGDDSLVSVSMPDSVTDMEALVFADCKNLRYVKLPAGLEELPGYTFNKCPSLTRCDIPEGVKRIGGNAFIDCTSLKALLVPAGASIDDYAVGFGYNGDTIQNIEGFKMYVYQNSPAEEYAKNFSVPYEYYNGQAIDGSDTKGDVNSDGKVNVTDVSKAAAQVKGVKSLDSAGKSKADVNGDGKVNVTDVSKIAAQVKGVKKI